ncbi:MAG: hypothetical protein JXN64_15915 [Spirochaetes bacterium]|nr:hypothetical protein [Spirochaetota bacterium]
MRQVQPSHRDITYFPNKLQHGNEKKSLLRKAIYDIARLSYGKGTRSGDYLLREIVSEINGELELLDNQIRNFDIELNTDLTANKEILPFFENRYFERFILDDKIGLLKQELVNQQEVDTQHNIKHKEKNYKRNVNNPFREELKKDLNRFESSIQKKLLPVLSAFLTDLAEILFYSRANEVITGWTAKQYYNETDKTLTEAVSGYLILLNKINNNVFSEREAQIFTDTLLSKTGIKERLLHLRNINEQKLDNIISAGAAFYCSCRPEKHVRHLPQENINKQNNAGAFPAGDKSRTILKNTLKSLKYLVEFSGNKKVDYVSVDRSNKYLFYSPETGKILLKDIAEYLKDSLVFIIDWFYIELKKDPGLIRILILLAGCLPDVIKFYELLNTAESASVQPVNRKKNIWGEVEQFVSRDVADGLVDTIKSLCIELRDAFVKTIIEVEFNKPKNYSVILKKINIIYNSFEDSQKKINDAMRRL